MITPFKSELEVMEIPLHKRIFKVTVPSVCLYSAEYIKEFGMTATIVNNKSITSYTDLRTVFLPIMKLLDIFESGFPIRVPEKDTINSIYKVMDDYISNVQEHEGVSIHMQVIDSNLALRLDKFSKDVFNINLKILVDDMRSDFNSFGFDSDDSLGIIRTGTSGVGVSGGYNNVTRDNVKVSGGNTAPTMNDMFNLDDILK